MSAIVTATAFAMTGTIDIIVVLAHKVEGRSKDLFEGVPVWRDRVVVLALLLEEKRHVLLEAEEVLLCLTSFPKSEDVLEEGLAGIGFSVVDTGNINEMAYLNAHFLGGHLHLRGKAACPFKLAKPIRRSSFCLLLWRHCIFYLELPLPHGVRSSHQLRNARTLLWETK